MSNVASVARFHAGPATSHHKKNSHQYCRPSFTAPCHSRYTIRPMSTFGCFLCTRRTKLTLAILVTIGACALAQSPASTATSFNSKPDRTVSGQTLTSSHDPAVRITFPPEFQYVGAVRWPLYDLADAELHLFVDAAPDKRIRRYYWVQFEQYLPTKPNARHNYSGSEAHAQIAGWDWYVDADVEHYPYKFPRPDSDGAHARRMLMDKGYTFPGATGQLRLVYLTDATTRKELMIIYEEDLATLGMEATKVEDKNAPQHVTLRNTLLDHAKAGMKIEPR